MAAKETGISEVADERVIVHHAETEALTADVSASPDRMKLFFSCQAKRPATAGEFSRLSLLELLPKTVPARLLHADVLDDIAERLSAGENISWRRIAKGQPSVAGRDGKLVFLVKLADRKNKTPEFVDPWFIKQFDNVEKGMIIARLYRPSAGIAGLDVLGETLAPQPGAALEVEVDETLSLQESADKSYSNISALQSGYLQRENNRLMIVHDLLIGGDVDPHTGDLHFVGSVCIKGSVKKNFRVTARENLEIHGNVQDGMLTSETGNILVKGHISGDVDESVTLSDNIPFQQLIRIADHRRPQITCAGTFHASVLDRVTLEAIGDIEIEKEARSSLLRTRATLRMPKGHLLGGEVHTVCGVEAETVGSPMGTRTRIILCSDIESSAEFGALIDKLRAHESAEEMIELYLGPYAGNPARIQLLQKPLREKMEKLRKRLTELSAGKAALLRQKEQLLGTARYNNVYRVNILKNAYPGLEIEAGDVRFVLDEVLSGPKTLEFLPGEKCFHIGDLQPLQCELERSTPALSQHLHQEEVPHGHSSVRPR
jgi:uncharacterized protein (DUF342 family)